MSQRVPEVVGPYFEPLSERLRLWSREGSGTQAP